MGDTQWIHNMEDNMFTSSHKNYNKLNVSFTCCVGTQCTAPLQEAEV